MLVPEYVAAKASLLELQRGAGTPSNPPTSLEPPAAQVDGYELEAARLEAKIRKIESDVLFDKAAALKLWQEKRLQVERTLAESRKAAKLAKADSEKKSSASRGSVNDTQQPSTISASMAATEDAERIAAELLAEADDDDDLLGGMFSSLPTNEVDAVTGKTTTVLEASDGARIAIRDFGKLTGVTPNRILEEACRAR